MSVFLLRSNHGVIGALVDGEILLQRLFDLERFFGAAPERPENNLAWRSRIQMIGDFSISPAFHSIYISVFDSSRRRMSLCFVVAGNTEVADFCSFKLVPATIESYGFTRDIINFRDNEDQIETVRSSSFKTFLHDYLARHLLSLIHEKFAMLSRPKPLVVPDTFSVYVQGKFIGGRVCQGKWLNQNMSNVCLPTIHKLGNVIHVESHWLQLCEEIKLPDEMQTSGVIMYNHYPWAFVDVENQKISLPEIRFFRQTTRMDSFYTHEFHGMEKTPSSIMSNNLINSLIADKKRMMTEENFRNPQTKIITQGCWSFHANTMEVFESMSPNFLVVDEEETRKSYSFPYGSTEFHVETISPIVSISLLSRTGLMIILTKLTAKDTALKICEYVCDAFLSELAFAFCNHRPSRKMQIILDRIDKIPTKFLIRKDLGKNPLNHLLKF
jgi:hypothetical protein